MLHDLILLPFRAQWSVDSSVNSAFFYTTFIFYPETVKRNTSATETQRRLLLECQACVAIMTGAERSEREELPAPFQGLAIEDEDLNVLRMEL
jgi:hypothetical protein